MKCMIIKNLPKVKREKIKHTHTKKPERDRRNVIRAA